MAPDPPPMVSYAQNREDVILARALDTRTGFYVDVGAASPSIASVTKHFYDLGWQGVNVEPLPHYAAALRAERPRDVTIEAAAGARSGRRVLCSSLEDLDQSTIDAARSQELRALGSATRDVEVDVTTLDDVLTSLRPTRIDFLKIDAEGGEREVLLGLDLSVWRPAVLVIEATWPNSLEPSHHAWEDLVTGRAYLYASTDGINRYYVAEERADLAARLVPANALDNYVPAAQQLLEEEITRMRAYVSHLEAEIAAKDAEATRTVEYVRTVEGELARRSEEVDQLRVYARRLEEQLPPVNSRRRPSMLVPDDVPGTSRS